MVAMWVIFCYICFMCDSAYIQCQSLYSLSMCTFIRSASGWENVFHLYGNVIGGWTREQHNIKWNAVRYLVHHKNLIISILNLEPKLRLCTAGMMADIYIYASRQVSRHATVVHNIFLYSFLRRCIIFR